MTTWMLFFVAAAAAIVLTLLKHASRSGTGSAGFPYRAHRTLFSPAERAFLGPLDQAVGDAYRVFGKVRVADIAAVRPGLGRSARQGALNRIAYKHFDFVVCRADDLSIVCAVELNDASHGSARARSRDALVAKVCSVIELPLLTVPARRAYAVEALREQFLASIAPTTSASDRSEPAHTRPNG